jgi:hypothetical protein
MVEIVVEIVEETVVGAADVAGAAADVVADGAAVAADMVVVTAGTAAEGDDTSHGFARRKTLTTEGTEDHRGNSFCDSVPSDV